MPEFTRVELFLRITLFLESATLCASIAIDIGTVELAALDGNPVAKHMAEGNGIGYVTSRDVPAAIESIAAV